MTRLVLHKFDGSPPAYAVRMLGDILGLQYELKDVDFLNMEHKSPEYVKINPLGTLPVLQDGDFYLVDSHAIMKYILAVYGGSQAEALYPSDARTRALVDQCLFFDTGVYFIRLKMVTLPTIYEGLKEPTAKHLKDIEDAYSVVEAYLGDKTYIAADHLTIADLSVGTTTTALRAVLKLDEQKFPRTVEWYRRLNEEPFFKKYSGAGFEIIRNIMITCGEKNKQKQ